MKNKLHSKRGETLAESLVAVLLIAMVAVALSVSIVAAAKTNAAAKALNSDCMMTRSEDTKIMNSTLTVSYTSKTEDIRCDIRGYEDNGFYFYDAG